MTNWKQEGQQGYSEEGLLVRFMEQRDNQSASLVFDRYLNRVYSYCRTYLSSEADCEDASMSVFERLLSCPVDTVPENVFSWLISIARNECLMIHRQRERLERREEDWEKLKAVDSPSSRPANDEDWELRIQKINRIRKAVDRLNKQQRHCIRLFYFQNKSYREIAEQTGFSVREVKSHLQNGKRNLKKILQPLSLSDR
jgi:RNA polymerase sigma-70 factor (ECF subfamily)